MNKKKPKKSLKKGEKICPECRRNYLQFRDDDCCSWCKEKHDKDAGVT